MADGQFDALLINSDPPRDAAPVLDVSRNASRPGEVVRRAPIFTALSAHGSGELTPFGREALARHGLHFANGLQLGSARWITLCLRPEAITADQIGIDPRPTHSATEPSWKG